ncbi:MAG TPA: sigma-70 family RNA polymerase sigma factor [Chitinophagales bacterium]|nr:sigma-70 family RNA polymerase sigma factor [Chitinophagales bacterium]
MLIKFEGRADFKTWIIRIMMNNCFRKKQKYSFKNELSTDYNETAIPMFNNSQNDGHQSFQNRELGFIIEDALGTIPENYRMVFSLREINQLSVADTATLLNISQANVKTQLNRAKAMLRTAIEKSYSANEIFAFNEIYCNAMVNRVMTKLNDLDGQ